jgi:hypothetical protein
MRDESYLTQTPAVRWSTVLSVAFVALYLASARDPVRPWSTTLVAMLGLLILSRALDGVRTHRVEFALPGGFAFAVNRRRAPLRFWILVVANCLFGAVVLLIAAVDALTLIAG